MMRMKRDALICFVLVSGFALCSAASAACGDVYADPTGMEEDVGNTETKFDSGVGSTVFPKDIPPDCPTSRPRENTACSASGATCEFGKSPDRQCNTMFACIGGGGRDSYWSPRPNDACHEKLCPVKTDIAALDGKPCTITEPDGGGAPITSIDEAVCNMTDGICACTTGRDGVTAHDRRWVCVRPISVCPPNRPLAGERCSGTLWCDYGSCAFKRGLLMECKDDHWLTGGAPCQ